MDVKLCSAAIRVSSSISDVRLYLSPTLVSMLRHSVSDGASVAVSVVILIPFLHGIMAHITIITIVQFSSYVNTGSKCV